MLSSTRTSFCNHSICQTSLIHTRVNNVSIFADELKPFAKLLLQTLFATGKKKRKSQAHQFFNLHCWNCNWYWDDKKDENNKRKRGLEWPIVERKQWKTFAFPKLDGTTEATVAKIRFANDAKCFPFPLIWYFKRYFS